MSSLSHGSGHEFQPFDCGGPEGRLVVVIDLDAKRAERDRAATARPTEVNPVETAKPRGRRLSGLGVVLVLSGAFWAAFIHWIVGIIRELIL